MKALFFITLIALSRATLDATCAKDGVASQCGANEFCYFMTNVVKSPTLCNATSSCGVCQTDCEVDDGCNGGLKCKQFTVAATSTDLPGCTGFGNAVAGDDYCYDDAYNTKTGNTCQACTDMHPQCTACSQNNIPKQNPTCTKCTAQGWVANGGTCKQCDASCGSKNCFDSGSDKCCYEGCNACTGLTTCTSCDGGKFPTQTGAECKTCTDLMPECETCTGYNVCTACANGKFPDKTTGSSCKTCVENIPDCDACSASNVCTTCKANTYPNGDNSACASCGGHMTDCTTCTAYNKCTACVSGQFPTADESACKTCAQHMTGCETCSARNVCTQCAAGRALTDDGTACKTCAEFPSMNNCLTCSSNKVCTGCSTGLGPNLNGLGCTSCSTQIGECTECTTLNNCTKCSNNKVTKSDGTACQTCVEAGLGAECTACSAWNVCTTCTGPNVFPSPTTGACVTCPNLMAGCSACTAADVCTTCGTGFFLNNNKNCSTCASSVPGCLECNAAGDQCTKCDSTTHWLDGTNCVSNTQNCKEVGSGQVSNTTCVMCDDMYGVTNGHCEKCATANCKQCNGVAIATECSMCTDTHWLNAQKTCDLRTACPDGKFWQVADNLCGDCTGECVTCLGGADKCTRCKTATLCANEQLFTCNTTTDYENTPKRFFHVKSKTDAQTQVTESWSVCGNCNDGCLTCSYVVNNPVFQACESCEKTSPVQWIDKSNFTCTDKTTCTQGTYWQESNNQCTTCDAGCAICNGTAKCDACYEGYNFNTENQQCCPESCKTCSANNVCDSCNDNFFLSNQQCVAVTDCTGNGEYLNAATNQCGQCSANCWDCGNDGKSCTRCADTFQLKASEADAAVKVCAATTCTEGTFWNEPTTNCSTCSTGCTACKNAQTCDVCTDTSSNCQGGFRWNQNSTNSDRCEACDTENCEKCDADLATCEKCFTGYNLTNNTCMVMTDATMKPCASGYFKNAEGKCMACKAGCKSCTTAENCFQCQKGVKWSATKNNACTFDCDTTCVDNQDGVFKCSTPKEGETLNPPEACALGWQYNGFALRCERTAPGQVCNSTQAPVPNKKWYLNGNLCQECELPANSNCLQCDVMKDSCYKCAENFRRTLVGEKYTCVAKASTRLLLEELGVQSLFDDFLK